MDIRHLLIIATACALVSATTWVGCRWWYGRKLLALTLRLQKIDKARQFSSQQTVQARKQIEALQKDLAAQNETMAKAQITRQRSRHLEEVLKAASATEPDSERLAPRPANGFADTQPMA